MNHYVPDRVPESVARGRGILKGVGICQIIFALMLVLVGFYSIATTMVMAVFPTWIENVGQTALEVETPAEESLPQGIDLSEDSPRAAFEAEKRAEMEELRKVKEIFQGMMPTALMYWNFTDALSGMLLNVFMFASGIGLLLYRRWAWRMALWVAALKIARLLLTRGIYIAYIAPIVGRGMSAAVGASAQGGFDAKQFALMQSITMTVGAVAMVLFGSIVPVVCLVLLTRKSVRSAIDFTPPESSS